MLRLKSTSKRLRAAAIPLAGLLLIGGTTAAYASGDNTSPSDWVSAGQNAGDTHSAPSETTINSTNVGTMKPKWTLSTHGNVSATPTVVNGTTYVPDWGGTLWAVNSTGTPIWSNPISKYSGISGDISRTSPAYYEGNLIMGEGTQTLNTTNGAYLFSVNASTGAAGWKTQVDSDPGAVITSSPQVVNGVVYVGVSSKDEAEPTWTPTFRGSIVALSATTGQILWKTYTVPQGYTGGAVWGSSPAVDPSSGLVYVGTGNNYTEPSGYCTYFGETGCTPLPSDDHIDSVLALNIKTGAIVWSKPTGAGDIGTPSGPDYDFGAAPNLYTTTINGASTKVLGIGQKSGMYYALNPATGAVLWQTQAGPGSDLGGVEWGTASDGKRIYLSIANADQKSVTLTSSTGQQSTTTGGYYEAIDAATGKILWQTADPLKGVDTGFVSAANGVVYTGSLQNPGNNMFALDAATGDIKWSFPSGGAVVGGAAISNGTVYWGTGYNVGFYGYNYSGDNNKLYAFAPTE